MSTLLYALGRWCATHYRRVFALWAVAVVALCAMAAIFNNGTRNEFEIPGAEAQEAINALARTFPEVSGTSAMLVVVAPESATGNAGRIDTPQTRSLIETAVSDLEDAEGVSSVMSPFDEDNSIGLSDDGQAARIFVQYGKAVEDFTAAETDELRAIAKPLNDADYTTAWGGDLFNNTGPQLSIIELIGVIVAFIVLYLTFRSLRAAVIPIVTAVVGVIVSMALITISTSLIAISSTAPLLALMIGLAVGIDYALFIVSRHREQLLEGVATQESAGRATATAGSAVVFAGVTVVIALVGLAIARIPFLTVMGIAAAAAVVVSVVVALTMVPALLGQAGERLRPKSEHASGNFSRRWVLAMIRFPKSAIAVVVLLLCVMTIPAGELRLALPDNGSAPHGSSQREAYDLVDKHFGPGHNGPLLLTADIISTTDPLGVVSDIEQDLKAMPGVDGIGLATPNRTGDTAVWQVIPTTGPVDQETRDLVNRIRETAPKWSQQHQVDVMVTGTTAGGIDISDRLAAALLPFGIVVVGLSVLLLMIVFRTIVVPLKATLGFLLSTGASLGAVVAVFQFGWLGAAVNLDQPGPLMSFLPIMLIAVLFGLSMDYEVFLMSRMKEEYVRFGNPRQAIVDGFVGSSRVVTAAAVIMLAVFAAFVPEGDPSVRPIAFALAVGVAIDAFLIRMLFAPAVLELFGKSSWTLPKKLDKVMPHIDVEGEALHRRVELESWPTPDSTAAVTAAGLTAQTSEGPMYNDVALSLQRGDWLIIHGPSGTGKTSLLLTLAGRMAFSAGRLRVAGHLLPQEARAARREVSLAEFKQINELDDNLTVDQHIAERLSISRFGLWVGRHRITPVRERWNAALSAAWRASGVTFEPISGSRLIGSLSPLERLTFSAALALIDDPTIVVIDDADIVRSAENLQLLWAALAELLENTEISLIASVQSPSSAPEPTERVQLLELNTTRTLSELMM